MRKQQSKRKQTGAGIAEAAAALSLMLPLSVAVIFVALESSYAYTLKSSLAEGAREAARDLAIAYGQDRSVADSRSSQNTKAFDKVRITNIINDSLQFDDPVFKTTADPATVTVTVKYKGGQYGLPPFPNPDPLKLGPNFTIYSTATYRLQ
jgi:hypothetical protein